MTTSTEADTALLEAMMNLTKFHREHEKFYASSPREFAVTLQRHARTLQALADQWSTTEASTRAVLSPYEGAEDLNSPAALQLDGVLFLEGEGRPAEISHLIRDLRNAAEDQKATGEWLAKAMESSWAVAAALVDMDGLADVLERVDFSPAALRANLADGQRSASLLYSAAEMISHAADLCSDSAGLVHDNERRWRIFRSRVGQVLADQGRTHPQAG